ncbi:MAG TPA: hypothetical protein VF283_01715 [Bryobacteraceae bacterium]
MEQAAPVLSGWANFYVIAGSSAGALTGLQFVVMSLLAGERAGGSQREIRAFGTPTVVLFCAALLISAGINVPWHSVFAFRCFIGACGGAGVCYASTRIWHALKAAYKPDAEDWLWYIALPLLGYAALLAAGILFRRHPVASLDAIAAITLLLLFDGIHNAWDTVTYIAVRRRTTEP